MTYDGPSPAMSYRNCDRLQPGTRTDIIPATYESDHEDVRDLAERGITWTIVHDTTQGREYA